MNCKHKGCQEEGLSLSEFCWVHLPDKDPYIDRLLHEAATAKDLSGHNLKGIVLKKAHIEKVNLSKANLSQADLSGASFFDCRLDKADLVGANLDGCDMSHSSLKKADLTKASLAGARLWSADLRGANLSEAYLEGADLWGARLFGVKLWHSLLNGARSITAHSFSDGARFLHKRRIDETGALSSEESYRDLKRYFIDNGMYNDASWASYREKTMERLAMKKKGDLNYFPSLLMSLLCGYGEKPYRIVLSALSAILIFAFIYMALGAIQPTIEQDRPFILADYIYYSTITFTTVGYGDMVPKPIVHFRLLAASEAFMGVFLTGLFIFTLARKYSAR